jgi:hypothetical protein
MMSKPKIDELPVVVFVEGKSDSKFMQVFIESIFGKEQHVFFIKSANGVSKLESEVIDFVMRLKPVCTTKAVLVIRDADEDPKASKMSVDRILSEAKKHRGDIKYFNYIFPFNDNTQGSLETLCLNILSEPEKDKYLKISNNAVDSSDKTVPHHIQKNRLYCYLSLFDEYAEWSLGINAEKGAFDFAATELLPLRKLLIEISETTITRMC